MPCPHFAHVADILLSFSGLSLGSKGSNGSRRYSEDHYGKIQAVPSIILTTSDGNGNSVLIDASQLSKLSTNGPAEDEDMAVGPEGYYNRLTCWKRLTFSCHLGASLLSWCPVLS